MKIKQVLHDLLYDKTDGDSKVSLSRSTAVATFLILSAGFVLACTKRPAWEIFLAYPGGTMLVFVPQLFLRMVSKIENIVKARYGGGNGIGE